MTPSTPVYSHQEHSYGICVHIYTRTSRLWPEAHIQERDAPPDAGVAGAMFLYMYELEKLSLSASGKRPSILCNNIMQAMGAVPVLERFLNLYPEEIIQSRMYDMLPNFWSGQSLPLMSRLSLIS